MVNKRNCKRAILFLCLTLGLATFCKDISYAQKPVGSVTINRSAEYTLDHEVELTLQVDDLETGDKVQSVSFSHDGRIIRRGIYLGA